MIYQFISCVYISVFLRLHDYYFFRRKIIFWITLWITVLILFLIYLRFLRLLSDRIRSWNIQVLIQRFLSEYKWLVLMRKTYNVYWFDHVIQIITFTLWIRMVSVCVALKKYIYSNLLLTSNPYFYIAVTSQDR